MPEESLARPDLVCLGPSKRNGQITDSVPGESQQVQLAHYSAEILIAVHEVVFQVVTPVFRALKLSFSIFHRALPRAASSTTVSRSTGKSVFYLIGGTPAFPNEEVTNLFRWITLPAALTIWIIRQLTFRASVSPRNGTLTSIDSGK